MLELTHSRALAASLMGASLLSDACRCRHSETASPQGPHLKPYDNSISDAKRISPPTHQQYWVPSALDLVQAPVSAFPAGSTA